MICACAFLLVPMGISSLEGSNLGFSVCSTSKSSIIRNLYNNVFVCFRICIVEEGKYHEGTIKFIQYSPNGKLMLVGDSNCFYCIYDTTRNYQPIKALPSNY